MGFGWLVLVVVPLVLVFCCVYPLVGVSVVEVVVGVVCEGVVVGGVVVSFEVEWPVWLGLGPLGGGVCHFRSVVVAMIRDITDIRRKIENMSVMQLFMGVSCCWVYRASMNALRIVPRIASAILLVIFVILLVVVFFVEFCY